LVRYYERLGFRQWKPRERITGKEVEMYHQAIYRLQVIIEPENEAAPPSAP
jgi:hypothetical protein